MRSELQIQASRANGARSRGPKTPEGKLSSSRNAMKHGMLSGTVVLEGESVERFEALLASFFAELQPQTPIEASLVENMAVARWRQMRIWGLEKATMEYEMHRHAEAGQSADHPATQSAIAFRTLSDESRSLELINRYEARYDRQYLRAHRRFLELQDRRTPPSTEPTAPEAVPAPAAPSETAILPNEPEPPAPTDQSLKSIPIHRHSFAAVSKPAPIHPFDIHPPRVSLYVRSQPEPEWCVHEYVIPVETGNRKKLACY